MSQRRTPDLVDLGHPPRRAPTPPAAATFFFCVDLSTHIDTEAIREAYNEVRQDTVDIEWLVLKYDGTRIVCSAKGTTFDKFKEEFGEDERAYGYIRVQMGDEMSKRQKFLLVTWVGQGVGVIKRAKMSTDKALVKNILSCMVYT
ncbi:Coactosin-like protein [Homalodisca vitripennis]|nr:Coactosin-like protein [Homalodisca vitripennis]